MLSLHSTLKDLVQYTRKGLDYISQVKKVWLWDVSFVVL
jgi:hypothetical protein